MVPKTWLVKSKTKIQVNNEPSDIESYYEENVEILEEVGDILHMFVEKLEGMMNYYFMKDWLGLSVLLNGYVFLYTLFSLSRKKKISSSVSFKQQFHF